MELDKLMVDERYVRPKAAYELMKKAQNIKQTVYICGTTGFGKTSLVADFLAKRKYEYHSIGNINASNLEKLANEHYEKERIIVFDDLHLIQDQNEKDQYLQIFNKLINDENVWLILISRSLIPAWLKPLYFQKIFVIIQEKDLLLNDAQSNEYIAKWPIKTNKVLNANIKNLAQGHPLCLRIILIKLQLHQEEIGQETNRETIQKILEDARHDWWDYLENHVYDQWDSVLQDFLMDMSIVEKFDVTMAQYITKKNDAGQLIAKAQESGNFIVEHNQNGQSIYEFRKPMQYSMQRRLLHHCTKNYIDDLYYSAGTCYELKGQIIDALKMYEKCNKEEAISRLLIENARRYAGAGYYWELRKYYLSLSEEIISQNAILMAGMSILQSIMLNDDESERWYQKLATFAQQATGSLKKEAQIRLMYLDIALPHRGTIDMVEIIKNAGTNLLKWKMMMPEFSLTNNQPSLMNGGKDFCPWSKKDKELAQSIGKIVEFILGKFGKGLVNLALAESLFEKGADNYTVSSLIGKGRLQAESDGKSELIFVAIGLTCQLSLLNNSLEDAIESINSFKKGLDNNPQLINGIDTFKVRMMLYDGLNKEIYQWMEQAPNEDMEFCSLERYSYITKVRVYLAMDKNFQAFRLLQSLLNYAQKRQRYYLEMECMILLAILYYRIENPEWEQILQDVIDQAESYHFVRIFSKEGIAINELLAKKRFVFKDKAYQKQVYDECRYMAERYPNYLSKQKEEIKLSNKAIKILKLQAEGLSVEQIAKILGLSQAGIKYHNQETYKKLGVNSKAQAVIEARNRKLI